MIPTGCMVTSDHFVGRFRVLAVIRQPRANVENDDHDPEYWTIYASPAFPVALIGAGEFRRWVRLETLTRVRSPASPSAAAAG